MNILIYFFADNLERIGKKLKEAEKILNGQYITSWNTEKVLLERLLYKNSNQMKRYKWYQTCVQVTSTVYQASVYKIARVQKIGQLNFTSVCDSHSAPDNMRICVKYACENKKNSSIENLRSIITH